MLFFEQNLNLCGWELGKKFWVEVDFDGVGIKIEFSDKEIGG